MTFWPQLQSVLARWRGRLGLGLSAAIAQAHGGHVTLRSQPKHGSTFTLILPLTPLPDSTP